MSFRGYKVDAVDTSKYREDKTPVFFNTLYSNCLYVAKKHSGKTNCLFHVLKNIVGKKTKIYIFCSTVNKDPTWLQIQDTFEKNIEDVKDTIIEKVKKGKRKVMVNHLENLVNSFIKEEGEFENKNKKEKNKKEEQKGGKSIYRIPKFNDFKLTWNDLEEDHLGRILFRNTLGKGKDNKEEGFEKQEEPKKKSKSKKGYPDKIVIIDDLSQQLRDPIVAQLAKTNRHFRCVFMCSTQTINDLPPQARSQFNQLFVFKGHSFNKASTIRKVADLDLDDEEFYRLYKETTKEPYSFMYVDIDNSKAYRNFDDIVYE